MSRSAAAQGRHIWGVLAPGGRISRNDNGYLPEELATWNGVDMNLYFDHEDFETGGDGRPTGRILQPEPRGRVKTLWNEDLQRLEYDGHVWDDPDGREFVSLAGEPTNFERFHGHTYPIGLKPISVSMVRNPGIPETTVNLEAVYERMKKDGNFQYYPFPTATKAYVMFESKVVNVEDELSAADRDKLRAKSFAAPAKGDEGDDKLPVNDAEHTRAAMARFNQTHFDNGAQKDAVKAKIRAAAKKFGIDVDPSGPFGEVYNTGTYKSPVVGEPLSPDFQKIKGAMSKQYGKKADDVYYGYLQKHGFDDTKPFPAQEYTCPHGSMLSECPMCSAEVAAPGPMPPPGLPPQEPDADDLTAQLARQNSQTRQTGVGLPNLPAPAPPGAGTGVAPIPGVDADPHLGGTGAPGVTGTSGLTPMQGMNVNPPVQPDRQVPNPYLKNTAEANIRGKGKRRSAMATDTVVEDKTKKLKEEEDALQQDETTDKGHDASVKSIGLAQTPYETVILSKVSKGEALSAQEKVALEVILAREKKVDNADVGTAASNPNNVSTIPTKEEEEEDDDDGAAKKAPADAEEQMTSYGYSKEKLESQFKWSTLSKSEQKLVAKSVSNFRREQMLAAVTKPGSVSGRSTAKTSQLGGGGSPYIVNGVDLSFPDLQKHIDNMAMSEQTGEVKHLYSRLPFLDPPEIIQGPEAMTPRLEFVNAISSFSRIQKKVMLEAIATTTTGAAMGVQANAPALIVPTNLAAILRDTVYFGQVPQGMNTARFQTVTVPNPVALTQNTEPSQATQTMATIDIVPTPRGVEQQISFEAERKIMGPILEAVILSFRLSELYDEDYLLIGGTASYGATGASQAFESGVVTGTGGVYNTANQLFGAARANEAAIIAADTMSVAFIDDAVAQLQIQGYATDNLVTVMFPQQYRKLLIDANALRLVSFGPNTDNARSMLAQGVIPELIGSELRRSTLGNTGTGSASITTYHAWLYKKGQTTAMAASRDLIIETYRDIRVNSTWVKGHWDLKANLLQPNSLIEILTA